MCIQCVLKKGVEDEPYGPLPPASLISSVKNNEHVINGSKEVVVEHYFTVFWTSRESHILLGFSASSLLSILRIGSALNLWDVCFHILLRQYIWFMWEIITANTRYYSLGWKELPVSSQETWSNPHWSQWIDSNWLQWSDQQCLHMATAHLNCEDQRVPVCGPWEVSLIAGYYMFFWRHALFSNLLIEE